jgi:hypothetical protein
MYCSMDMMRFTRPDPCECWLTCACSLCRECWCAQEISTLSAKLDDKQCNYSCPGNNTMACGGSLKLSVYELSGALEIRPCWNLLLASSLLLTILLFLQ